MIVFFLGVITFSVGGGGGVSPPQWFYNFGGYIYFIEEGFEPSVGVEYSKVFNFPTVNKPVNYKEMKVYTYFLKILLEYPLFVSTFYISPGAGLLHINQVQKVWFEYEYEKRTYYTRALLFRITIGKASGNFRFSIYYEKETGSGYGYGGLNLRRVLL